MVAWEDVEDNVLLQEVKDAQDNGVPLKSVFQIAAEKLDRSVSSVKNRWYSELSEKFKNGDVGPAKAPAKVPTKQPAKPKGKPAVSSEQPGTSKMEQPETSIVEQPDAHTDAPDTSSKHPEGDTILSDESAVSKHTDAPTGAPTGEPSNNEDTTAAETETAKKYTAGEVVLQRAGVHVMKDEDDEIPAGTAPALIKRAELIEEPYIKVALSPITKAQLDIMSETELFELMMNVTIKIQELSNKKSSDIDKGRRDLVALNREYEEVKVGYTSLLGVINTAREMAMKESERLIRPSFQMESNGNLRSV
jgi:hypothetical protein